MGPPTRLVRPRTSPPARCRPRSCASVEEPGLPWRTICGEDHEGMAGDPPQHGAARGPSALQTARGARPHPALTRENRMAEQHPQTYKLIELVGTSPTSYADATKQAVERAGETLRGLGWFEVTQLRGLIDEGRIGEYQVTVKVGFQVLEHDPA